MPARKVPRSVHESARDVARDIARTEAYVTSRRERKEIEMLFAHLKRILRLDRLGRAALTRPMCWPLRIYYVTPPTGRHGEGPARTQQRWRS